MKNLKHSLALLTLAIPFVAQTQIAQAAQPKADIPVTANYVTTQDGVQIYYKDWGPRDGQVVTFSHGWPLSSDSSES